MIASIFFVAHVATLAALASAGYFGLHELLLGIALLPGFLIGYFLARRFLVLKNPKAFRSGLLLVAAASAIALIVRG